MINIYSDIPNWSRYKITRQGVVVSKSHRQPRKFNLGRNGYLNALLITDDGRQTTVGLHQLLALAFIAKPKTDEKLIVNHINGIKTDNRLSNLEWVTYQRNTEHAGELGLTTKCIPVETYNPKTGEVKKYPSFIKCATDLGLTKDQVAYRVGSGQQRVFPEGYCYRKANNAEPWFPVSDLDHSFSNHTPIDVLFMVENRVHRFERNVDVAEELGVSPAAITSWLKREDQPVLPGMIMMRYAGGKPWRKVEDPYLDHEAFTKKRCIVVQEIGNETPKVFLSAKAAAEYIGIRPTLLDWWLKNNHDGVLRRDKWRVSFYNEFKRSAPEVTLELHAL